MLVHLVRTIWLDITFKCIAIWQAKPNTLCIFTSLQTTTHKILLEKNVDYTASFNQMAKEIKCSHLLRFQLSLPCEWSASVRIIKMPHGCHHKTQKLAKENACISPLKKCSAATILSHQKRHAFHIKHAQSYHRGHFPEINVEQWSSDVSWYKT